MPFGSCKCFIRTLLSNSGETCIPLWSFDNKITIVSKLYILLKSFVRLYYQLLNTCTLFLSFSMLFLLQSQCKCLSLGPHIPLGIFFVPYAPLCFISKPICPFFLECHFFVYLGIFYKLSEYHKQIIWQEPETTSDKRICIPKFGCGGMQWGPVLKAR